MFQLLLKVFRRVEKVLKSGSAVNLLVDSTLRHSGLSELFLPAFPQTSHFAHPRIPLIENCMPPCYTENYEEDHGHYLSKYTCKWRNSNFLHVGLCSRKPLQVPLLYAECFGAKMSREMSDIVTVWFLLRWQF